MPGGRPTKVTPKVQAEICRRLGNGELLVRILETEGMPTKHSIHRALDANEQFRDEYARAREKGVDSIIEQGMVVASNDANDQVELDDGRVITNHEVVARSRLHWDAIRWYASKMAPKKYGDKITAEVDGKLEITVTRQYADKGDSSGT